MCFSATPPQPTPSSGLQRSSQGHPAGVCPVCYPVSGGPASMEVPANPRQRSNHAPRAAAPAQHQRPTQLQPLPPRPGHCPAHAAPPSPGALAAYWPHHPTVPTSRASMHLRSPPRHHRRAVAGQPAGGNRRARPMGGRCSGRRACLIIPVNSRQFFSHRKNHCIQVLFCRRFDCIFDLSIHHSTFNLCQPAPPQS